MTTVTTTVITGVPDSAPTKVSSPINISLVTVITAGTMIVIRKEDVTIVRTTTISIIVTIMMTVTIIIIGFTWRTVIPTRVPK
jgi:hypothetical protein